MKITTITPDTREQIFSKAYDGSYYTITGCGGQLKDWTDGYAGLLAEERIGIPSEFFTFHGADMNAHYILGGDNAYKDELVFLMFPLDGLDVGKLAIFKLKMADRWFDDIVDNNRRRQGCDEYEL